MNSGFSGTVKCSINPLDGVAVWKTVGETREVAPPWPLAKLDDYVVRIELVPAGEQREELSP